MKKGICLSVALAAVGLLITSCFVPETFTATVRITKDYQYAVEYNGTVGFGPALEEIAKKGKLSPQDNAMFMASTEELFPKKDGFQSASYKGDGRWKVEWKQEGTLTNTVHCFGPDVPVASLARLRNGAIQFNGMRINEADIASLKQVKFTVNGTVEVSTDCKVTRHNATEKPSTRGAFATYTWKITSDKVISPVMVLETPSTVPSADTLAPALVAALARPGRPAANSANLSPLSNPTREHMFALAIGEGELERVLPFARPRYREWQNGQHRVVTDVAPGARATFRVTNAAPVFRVSLPKKMSPPSKHIHLLPLTCSENERTADIGVKDSPNSFANIKGIPLNVEVTESLLSSPKDSTRYLVTPQNPLPAGEYLIGCGTMWSEFGIDPTP